MTPTVEQLLVAHTAQIRDALLVIDGNGLGIAFVVDAAGRLLGVATDGDVRRALLRGATSQDPVTLAMNAQCLSLPVTARNEAIHGYVDKRARVIPLLGEDGCPVDYASVYRDHKLPVMEPSLSGNELKYVMECIATNWISSQGAFVRRFERELARYVDMEHAVAVCNGTAALHLALAALGVGAGDEVIVPDLTFAASINAVLYVGATPVLADVDRRTWTIDPDEVARLVGPRTKAIMPVHLYGQPADMGAIMEIARRHKLYVVEDAAEALGALYRGRQAGSFGDASGFSFFGNKLITTGEGGMVVFRDTLAAERARMLRDHGMDPLRRYWHPVVGFNYRLTNLQAAIGTAQIEQIDGFLRSKLELAATYRNGLGELDGIELPVEREDVRNVYWLFSILVDPDVLGLSRGDLMDRLLLNGIETRPLFFPLHLMPPYQPYVYGRSFPNADWLSARGLSLPSAVTLAPAEAEHVCRTIRSLLEVRSLCKLVETGAA